MAAEKTPSFEFVTNYLTRHPSAPYADVKAAAEQSGYTIYPIVYGRAQALLGIVKTKARGEASTARSTGRPRGRPPKAASAEASGSAGGLDSLVTAVRAVEQERDRMRSALLEVRDRIDAAL